MILDNLLVFVCVKKQLPLVGADCDKIGTRLGVVVPLQADGTSLAVCWVGHGYGMRSGRGTACRAPTKLVSPLLHLHHGDSGVALAVRGEGVTFDQRVLGQPLPDGISHSAGALAVDDAHLEVASHEGGVQVRLQSVQGLVHREAA